MITIGDYEILKHGRMFLVTHLPSNCERGTNSPSSFKYLKSVLKSAYPNCKDRIEKAINRMYAIGFDSVTELIVNEINEEIKDNATPVAGIHN